jgi:glucokinase
VTSAGGSGAPDAPTIGIDLGGTNLRVAVVDRAGEIVADERESTPDEFPKLIEAIKARVDAMVTAHGDVTAVGIGAAGLVDGDGIIHYAPNIPMFRRAPVGPELSAALTLPVAVDNDANVAAYGELCHGAARGKRDVLVITLGTGIGGGLILDGRVYQGAHGFAAEVGHWQLDPDGDRCACGELGHWEASASGTALGRIARQRASEGRAAKLLASAGGDVDELTGLHVGDAARAGDRDALEILDEYGRRVALGFVGLANILDPELIVVSGGVVELGDLLLDPIRRAFDGHLEGAAYRPPVAVVAAELGSQAGVVGAAAMARELAP